MLLLLVIVVVPVAVVVAAATIRLNTRHRILSYVECQRTCDYFGYVDWGQKRNEGEEGEWPTRGRK